MITNCIISSHFPVSRKFKFYQHTTWVISTPVTIQMIVGLSSVVKHIIYLIIIIITSKWQRARVLFVGSACCGVFRNWESKQLFLVVSISEKLAPISGKLLFRHNSLRHSLIMLSLGSCLQVCLLIFVQTISTPGTAEHL